MTDTPQTTDEWTALSDERLAELISMTEPWGNPRNGGQPYRDITGAMKELQSLRATARSASRDRGVEATVGATKLRFFRDLNDNERCGVFLAFGVPREAVDEATTHSRQSLLFDHIFGRLWSLPAPRLASERENREIIKGEVGKEAWSEESDALSVSQPIPEAGGGRRGIYIASKVAHAQRWRLLRNIGYPIMSTWIDEAGVGESQDLNDLWQRCIREASAAEVLVLNREGDEVLKGGWIELGAALGAGVPVLAIGVEEFTVAHDKRIHHFPSMKDAMTFLKPMCNGTRFDALPPARDLLNTIGTGTK